MSTTTEEAATAIVVYWTEHDIGYKCVTPTEAEVMRQSAIERREEITVFGSEDSFFTGKVLLELTNIKAHIQEVVVRARNRRVFLEPLIKAGFTNDQLKLSWDAYQRVRNAL